MYKFTETRLRGKIHIKHGFPFKGKYFASTGKYIVLTPGNFEESGGFKLDLDKAKFYTGEVPDEYVCANGDLIVAMTEQVEGLLGSAAIVPEDDRFLHNQRIGLITVDDTQIDKTFLYHLLKTKTVRQQLRRSSSGSKVKHTSPDRIYDVVVSLPEVPAQKRIASVLSALDSKIEHNKLINAKLEAMARVLYGFWFVQFDFPDNDGRPYKSSGGKMCWNKELNREIPDGWEVERLADITEVSNESINPLEAPNDEFRHYSIPSFDETGTYKIEKGKEIKSNKFLVNETDVLVSKLNPWFNRVIFSTDEKNLICSTEFVVWRTRSQALKNYLFMVARDDSFVSYCTRSASGTSHSHKRVNPSVMMRYQVACNKKVAETFGSKIESALQMFARNDNENQQLAELRNWLVPMLMNGQVKVCEGSVENALENPLQRNGLCQASCETAASRIM